MSSKINNTTTTNKPFCKVCQDAGKSEKIYTSHYVKDRSGNTTCPTLLAQECRYCFKKGHTTKFCQVLKNKQEEKTVQEKPKYVKQNAPAPKPASVFAYLDFSSDEESDKEEEQDKETAFPALTTAIVVPTQPIVPGKISYASMAAKTKVEYKIEQYTEKKELPPIMQEKILSIPIQPFKNKYQKKIDWATAESDSEGDEEEQEFYASESQQNYQEDHTAW